MLKPFTHTKQLLTLSTNLLCGMLVLVLSASCIFEDKEVNDLTPKFQDFKYQGHVFFDCDEFDELASELVGSSYRDADTLFVTGEETTDTAGIDSVVIDSASTEVDTASTISGFFATHTSSYDQINDNTLITEPDSVTILGDNLSELLEDTLQVIIATQDMPNDLGLEIEGEKYSVATFVDDLNRIKTPEAKIKIESTGQTITIPQSLATRHFTKNYSTSIFKHLDNKNIKLKVLATCDGEPVAIRLSRPGGGNVTLITVPFIFTNYGLSYDKNCHAVIQLLCDAGLKSTTDGQYLKPFVRYFSTPEYDLAQSEENRYEFIKTPDVNEDILYILLIFILVLGSPLLVRRRQQVIPVYKAPTNHTAEFVKQVSKVYLQQKEFGIILRKRIIYFFSEVQDRFHIQLANEQDLEANTAMLAAVTNTDAKELRSLIERLQKQLREEPEATKEGMIYDIDQIEKLTETISNVK